MGHPGFSYIGLLFLLLLFIPNFFWTKHKPQDYNPTNESKLLLALERFGEAAVTCCALAFSDFNLKPWSPWSLWLIGAFLLMLLYELWWVRYFRGPHTLADFYSSLLGVPVAGASFPVAAFLLLGIYGRVIWMVVAALILGVGHIGIHLSHKKELEPPAA